jgi:prevent-host-death family protein
MTDSREPNVVGAFDAKNKLGQLLDQVARGEVIVITRHGTPIARLVPFEADFDRADAQRAVRELRTFRRGNRLPAGVTIRGLVAEGRR